MNSLLKNVETLKYAELQQLAKCCGIKANLKADKLRAALLEYRETQSDVGSKTIESSTNFESVINCETNVDHQAEPLKPFESSEPSIDHELEKQMNMPLTEHESANILDSNTAATCGMTAGSIAEAVPSDESSEVNNMEFESSGMDCSKCCISPDPEVTVRRSMVTRRSTFDANEAKSVVDKKKPASHQATAVDISSVSSIKKPINWSAIHQRAFSKMDSLDVYLEKKQVRRRYLRTPPKRAAALSTSLILPNQKTSEQVSRVKPSAFVPSVFSTAHINTNFMTLYKTPSADVAGRRVSKTGTAQNSVNAKQPFKENWLHTPGDKTANKSILSTSIVSAKKPVFDLKASLSKPLNYTPHRGKLKPFSVAHVDVKQATKAKTRDQRRNEMKAVRQVQRQAAQMARRQ